MTIEDAADHIRRLPKAEHDEPRWQTAILSLIMAAEDRGPVMHARIGVLRALNHGRPAPTVERRKRAKKYRIVK